MNDTITTNLIFEGSTDNAYETTLAITDPTADRTWTIPDATDTSVGRATTDTLTNKTLTAPDINTPDIDGGTVDAITSLTVANSVDIGNYTLTANGLTIDGTFTCLANKRCSLVCCIGPSVAATTNTAPSI